MLEQRYGAGVSERQNAMFAAAGLPHAERREKIPNSRRALMLGELARERGVYETLHQRLFEAYWAHDRDIGDIEVLIEEGVAAGLQKAEVVETIESQRYLDVIERQTDLAIELGAGGVPAWVIDERALVPGAQPHEVFERVLERLGYEPLG